jgi:uncharacterized protein (DUF305 family)
MLGPRTGHVVLLAILPLVLGGFGLSACGEDESTGANSTDGAFAAEMIPHHEMAVDMAESAQENASRAAIRELADDIITAQNAEIGQLRAAVRRMDDAGVDAGDLDMSEAAMGMGMDTDMLEGRAGFDRMFIDMMIPHHQGAIRMARAQLADGADPEMRTLAKAIIAAQSREIQRMNAWRTDWYGSPSPAGGVPREGEDPPMHGGDHGGG